MGKTIPAGSLMSRRFATPPGACNVAQSSVLLNTYKSLGLREISLRHSLSSWPRDGVRNHKKEPAPR
jgi:hypothetical protein